MSYNPAQVVFYFYLPMFLIDCSVFSALLYRFYCNEALRPISAFQRRSHIFCFGTILMTAICDMGHAFGAMITDTSLIPKIQEIGWIAALEVSADFFGFFGWIMIYVILIERLYSTFKHTSYQLTRCTLTMVAIMMVIQSLCMVSYCTFVGLVATANPAFLRISSALSASVFINDILLNIFFFVLFIRKLRQSVIMRMVRDRCKSVDESLRERLNTKIVDVIVKQTLIGTTVIAISTGFLLTSCITYAINGESSKGGMFAYSYRAIEGVQITIVLYLGLSNSVYRAFLIRPKICCLPPKFGGKQQILGLIRNALYETVCSMSSQLLHLRTEEGQERHYKSVLVNG